MATALNINDPYIVPLDSVTKDSDVALYGIYSGAPCTDNLQPKNLIILNLAYLPANSTDPVKPAKNVNVSSIFGKRAKVTRLTAPGSDSISGATLAGQSFDSGKAKGRKVIEKVTGIVTVRSSEAVIIETL